MFVKGRFEAIGDRDRFLRRTIAGDQLWVHYFQPGTKRASKEW